MKKIRYTKSKREVAEMSKLLTTYTINHPMCKTPLADFCRDAFITDLEQRMNFFSVAQLLGWKVERRGDVVYENRKSIWTIDGN